MAQLAWDPRRYLKFGDHRTRAAVDLLARVPSAAPRRVVDLGCGPGNSTRLLVERWPQAQVTGVDRSPEMLAAARTETDLRDVSWVEASVEDWSPAEPPEVIFSNAMLQYVAEHERVFPRLLGQLAAGGVLAVQIPYRVPGLPWLEALQAIACEGAWSERFRDLRWGEPSPAPAAYYDYLAVGAAWIDVWTTEYLQVLTGADPVLEWTRGTSLLSYLARLPQSDHPEFERRYAERLRALYPRRADGSTLFPFLRLFIVAGARSS